MRRAMRQTASADQIFSAVQLLRDDKQRALLDGELMLHLDELLTALGLELKAGRESIPETVRRAALQLSEYLVRSSIPGLSDRAGANAPTVRDRVPDVLTTPSRLTRMG